MSEIYDKIRAAIEQSNKSRYRIAKDLEFTESGLCRFMKGSCGLSIERLELLANYFDLEIVIRPKGNKR